MIGFNEEEERGFGNALFISSSDNNSNKEKIEKSIREMLIANGYTIDENGNIYSAKNSIKDGILGFVVGDALGVPVEFASREMLKKYPIKQMIGYGRYDEPNGTWSDDTSMVLATMDSIINNRLIDYEDIMFKFSEWMDQAKYTATDNLFDIGITTRKAIINFKRGVNALDCGSGYVEDNGNGSLMRILPIAFYLYNNEFSELEEIEIINNISSLTHAHEISRLGCKIYYDYMKQLLDGIDKKNALKNIKNKDYSSYYSYKSIVEYRRILRGDISKLSVEQIKSSGYVVDTLEASLWCTLNSSNFEEAVSKAVNLGNDTDTIGAITGSLNGIIYGKDNIPMNWLNKIRKKGYIDDLILEFTKTLKNSDNKSIGRR